MNVAMNDPVKKAFLTQQLFDAVLASDIVKAAKAIEDGADVNGTEVDRPLVAAVLMGNAQMVQMLLQKGADVERQDRSGTRCFFHALETTRLDLIEMMLEHGASPTKPNHHGQTPLHIAAEGCCADVMRLLINGGCKVDDIDSPGRTPMYVAASSSNGEGLRFLLREGANPSSKPTGLYSAQRKAEEAGNHGCIFLLIAYGGKVEDDLEGDFTMMTPLEASVACGDSERFAELLEQKTELPADELEQLRYVCEGVSGPDGSGSQMAALLNAWIATRTMKQISAQRTRSPFV